MQISIPRIPVQELAEKLRSREDVYALIDIPSRASIIVNAVNVEENGRKVYRVFLEVYMDSDISKPPEMRIVLDNPTIGKPVKTPMFEEYLSISNSDTVVKILNVAPDKWGGGCLLIASSGGISIRLPLQ